MGKSRPPKVYRYSMHFKATAVRLNPKPTAQMKDALDFIATTDMQEPLKEVV